MHLREESINLHSLLREDTSNIFSKKKGANIPDSLISIPVTKKDNKIDFLVISKTRFQKLQKDLAEKYFADLKTKDLSIKIKIANDIKQNIEHSSEFCYIDGTAYLTKAEKNLNKSGYITIAGPQIAVMRSFTTGTLLTLHTSR